MALGLAAGFAGGLLGIGGGVVIVPGLVLIMGLSQHRAHGTSLFSALFLAVVGFARYTLDGNISLPIAAGIAAGGVLGAVLGAKAAGAMRSVTLRWVFAGFLVLVSARMVMTGLNSSLHSGGAVPLLAANSAAYWAGVVVTGLVTGFVSGLFGVGGGTVMIPAMVLVLGVPQIIAQGISLAAMIPTAVSGVITHTRLGNVDFEVGKWTAVGAALGAVLGASVAARLENNVLQLVFAGFILFVALMLVMRKPNADT